MGSYSDWITSRRELYKTAITNAYAAHLASSGNDYETAYDAMNADSDIRILIPPQNNTAFYGSTPNASEAQITELQTWLQANPIQAGRLNLAVPTNATDETIRKALGGSGVVGTEKRRWKGKPLYTFPNGVLVGKNEKIIAALGTSGGAPIDGFGTDTLVYFDGIPFSKGTGLPGTAVFAGDLVVSGSLQGTGGIVIIDDVIQLERGVSNPAGIGVDDTGKIRLRHRGQGFLDLVDEVEKAKSGSIEEAKLWVGTQNTNSARWGNSLIPNSNFSLIRAEGSYITSNYIERPAGVISAGTTSEIVTLTDGIATFAANGQGIIMQAIPVDCERYTIRIRYKGSTAVTPTGNSQAQGIFLAFHETSDDDATISGKSFIYDNATPATNTSDNSSVHTGNVTVKYPTSLRSTDSSTFDGAPISTTYTIRSYTYEPTAGTKNASLVIHASNYGSGTLDLDYVVLTENPKTTAEINNLITTVTDAIQGETGSDITDAQMTNKSNWAAIGSASLEDNADGGDGGVGDAAIEVTTTGAGQGITSSAVDCISDRYLVGIRIRTSSGTTNISIAGVETAGPHYAALGDDPLKLVPGASNYRTNSINVDTINGSGQPSGSPAATQAVGTAWTTIIGTYEPNRLNPSSYAVGYVTPTEGPSHILPGKFSLAIRADSACTFIVDYVFASPQAASVNLAQSLANSAYGDSQTFVTTINDLIIKESGSIITNASMALPSNGSSGPAGYRARGTNAVIATVTDSEGDKQVKVTSSEAEGVDRVLISPPFALGQADKFSIGVRCKSLETGDVDVSIAIALTDQTSLPSGKVTYADSGGSDVYTTSVIESQLTIDNDSNAQGGDSSLADEYDWAVGTSYENVVGTFQRKAVDSSYSKKSASVIITANGDFEVDYIFVKEQVCSFDLAETTAEDKRDEAIAQATGALQGMTNSLGQESGSLLANASFGSYIYDGSAYQIPKNWAKTRSTTRIQRVVGVTEAVTQGSQTVTPQGEDVDAISQVGACALVTTGGNINGILSSYFQLPYNASSTNTGLGKYTLGLRLKVDKAETVGIRILAHEASSPPNGSQEFILCTSSTEPAFTTGTTRASTIHSDHSAKTYAVTAGSTGSTAQVALINISQNDTDVGFGSDDFIEYFPVDNSETQGDTDATIQNENDWYTVAGTYTPSSGAQYVSFEFIIEDQDTGDASRANLYIDYVSLVAQTIDADFASTIATARTEDAIDNIEDDPPQMGELISNPFFVSSNKTKVGGYPKKWLPYGSNPPFSILSFVNTVLKRGLHVAGTDSTHAGVFSRPFRTSSDDYEIKVRAKRSATADTNAKIEVYVYEYNSDIPDTVEAIISHEGHVPSSKTVSGGHVVVYDTVKTMAATSHADDTDPGLGTSYETYTYEYIPSDSCRYASILVRTDDLNTTGFDIARVSCTVDNTKTGNRLFGAFRGKALSQLDLVSFGDSGNLRSAIATNSGKTTFPGFGDAGLATAVRVLNDGDFPSTLRNSAVDATHVGLGNVTDKSASQLAADTNFTGNFGSLTAVNTNTTGRETNATNISTNVTNLGNVGTRMSNIKSRKKRAGKSKMGVFDNGRMTLTEDIGTFSIANTTESLKPAGWETYGHASDKVGYKTGTNNKTAQIVHGRFGMISPAFEIKEDKYKFKIRVQTNRPNMNFSTSAANSIGTDEFQLVVFYTTVDDLDGEYILPGSSTTTIDSADQHTTTVSTRKLAANSANAISTSGYSIRTFEWDPASNVTFASVMIYKYYATYNTLLYVDWITGFSDTRSLRPTATSLNINSLVGFSPSSLASNSAFTGAFRGSTFMPTFSQVAGTTSSGATVDIGEIGGFSQANRLVRTTTNTVRGVSSTQMAISNIYANNDDIRMMGCTVGALDKPADDGQLKIYQSGHSYANDGLRILNTNLNYWNIFMRAHNYSGNVPYALSFTMGTTERGYMGTTDQNLFTFTGQHRNIPSSSELYDNHEGLIVVSTGVYDNFGTDEKPQINESLPIVELATKRNQKSCWGVISNKEDYSNDPDNAESSNQRILKAGCFASLMPRKENEADRLIVNSLGEGAIWVCNINGNLENGDYMTTCEIPGYGMLQDDDLLHNYTVAKITQDCNFELDNPLYDCVEFEHEGNTYRKAFVGCTYHCG